MNIGDIFFAFRGESQQLIADAKKAGDQAGTTAGQSFGKKMSDGLRKRFSAGEFKKGIVEGLGLGAGLGAFNLTRDAIQGVINVGQEAISMASDLSESQSKVNVVFAEGADEVLAWGKNAASSMGLSEQAALEAAGTFGNFIQALGNSREEAQAMSMDIVGLAADLASFNNVDINEVILALRSGLAGEAEPMRRLGVSISATRVESNILAKGIAKTKAEITDAMKVSERYAIIMEDTRLAQGDFARTSDGLANSQRILAARIDNLKASLGTALLPVVEDTVKLFSDLVDIISGPKGLSLAMDEYIAKQREAAGLAGEVGKATDEWVSGLGTLEDMEADTIFGDLMPHLKEAVVLWRQHGEELSRNGDSFHTWRQAFFKAKDDLGLTSEEALRLTLQLANQSKALDVVAAQTAKAAREDALFSAAQDDAADTTERVALTAEDAKEGVAGLVGPFRSAGAALSRMVDKAADGSVEILQLARDMDLSRDSFKSFWQSVRENQRRTRFFIRHPDKVKDELRKINGAIRKAEAEKRRLEQVEGKKRNTAAIALIDQRIRELRSRRDDFRNLGAVYGNAAESGMETNFDPNLTVTAADVHISPEAQAKVNRALGGIGGAGGRASGGMVTGPSWVGEFGRELAVPTAHGVRIISRERSERRAPVGNTINVTTVGMPMRARTPVEQAQQLRRASRLGWFSPRPQPAFAKP